MIPELRWEAGEFAKHCRGLTVAEMVERGHCQQRIVAEWSQKTAVPKKKEEGAES